VARQRGRRLGLGAGAGLLAAVCGAGLAGCERGAKTPDEAYQRLAQAVQAHDGGQLYDALDLPTRWSWMSVQRAQRESYDIVLSNYPPGPERERSLHRFEAGARSESASDLFARQVEARVWSDLAAAVAAVGPAPHMVAAGTEVAVIAGGRTLAFRKGQDGHWGWGYSGLAAAAEDVKRRATADLELVRTSAADYERAAARQSR
jgi:hypothetical protein